MLLFNLILYKRRSHRVSRNIPLIILLWVVMVHPVASQSAPSSPVDAVYPLLDAAHSRWFYFSSASQPFGMVNLFPDHIQQGEWDSGYRYGEDTVRGFTHIHEWQLAGVSMLPVTFSAATRDAVMRKPASWIKPGQDTIRVGYHAIHLERYHIAAALTASNRAGFHRYVYPAEGEPGVVMPLGGLLGPSQIIQGGFRQTGPYDIEGYMVNGPTFRRVQAVPVYFHITFNTPIASVWLQEPGKSAISTNAWSGTQGTLLITFAPGRPLTVLAKVGVSYTSEAGALRNLQTEIPHWDFVVTERETRAKWHAMLNRIRIQGGSNEQRRRFYTDLWRALQGRRIMNDADGQYADLSGDAAVIRQLPLDSLGHPRFNMYNSDAFWGAQWTLNTLWQLVYPDITDEFCQSLMTYYHNSGAIPRGPSGGRDTYVMTGASTTPFMVAAWQKGIRSIDAETLYTALKKNHMPGGAMSKAGYEHRTAQGGGLDYYITKGYVPYPLHAQYNQYGYHEDGAGMTLEYAYQDWTLAQLAKALGKQDDYTYWMRRASAYRNLYNPVTGYIQPKDSLGKWKIPFNPLEYDHGYVEGNAAQFTWFVPHDLSGLFSLMGGRQVAIDRLQQQFEASAWHRFCNEHPEERPKFVNERRTWLNYSNQPSMQVAFIFNHAGAPWLTQFWSREVVNQVFSGLSPYTGYSGEEDQGLMGALSVLMKLGLFQMTGGCDVQPVYELGSPLFERVEIDLHPRYYPGGKFVLEAPGTSSPRRYLGKVRLNGRPLRSFSIPHADLVRGGKLTMEMRDTPGRTQ